MSFQFESLSKNMSLLNIDLPTSTPTSTSTSTSTFSQRYNMNSSLSSSNNNIQFNLENYANNIDNTEVSLSCSSDELEINPIKSARTLRRRLSENDYFLRYTNRRTIQKPNKVIKKDSIKIKSSDIKKLYSNQSLKGFRPSNLETIFEEPNAEELIMSVRKYNRNRKLSNGLNVTKIALKKRREKIKTTFGRKIPFKRISLEIFHEKLNSSMEENTNDSNYIDEFVEEDENQS